MPVNHRSYWTDADKARVWVCLEANEGNLKRTSDDTNIPRTTIRDFVKEWERNGGQPPASVMRIVRSAREDFVSRMEVARAMTMDRLIEIIPEIKNAQQAATVIGILDDKITRAKNVRIPSEAPEPASLEQVQDQVGQWLLGAVAKAASRRIDTVESTAVEQADTPALSVVSSNKEQ